MNTANAIGATAVDRSAWSRDGLSHALPAAFLLAIVFASPHVLPGWASMLVNCGALLLGLKHYVWLASPTSTHNATTPERIKFYLLWPGMDVAAFLNRQAAVPRLSNWIASLANTAVATGLLWIGVPLLRPITSPEVLGIFAMLVGTLLIHSGLFHTLALLWQAAVN